MRALLLIAALLLAGCEHFAPRAVEQGSIVKTAKPDGTVVTENRSDYATYVAENGEARRNPPKAFEFTCPTAGCNFTSFTAYQTGGTASPLAPPATPPKAEHAFVGMMREAKETVLGVVPFASTFGIVKVMGGVVGKVADRMAESTAFIASRPPTQSNTFVVDRGSALAVGGSATANNPTTTLTTTLTDRHDTTDRHDVNNSNNTTPTPTTP